MQENLNKNNQENNINNNNLNFSNQRENNSEQKQHKKNKFSVSNNKYPQRDLNLFIGTWNIGGQDLDENFSLIPWLCPQENETNPDMYVLGFQEIVDLSAKNIIISSNTEKIQALKNIVTKNLKNLGNFTIVKVLDLVGILFMIFIKENLCEFIKNIETSIVKTGLMGTLGNKGNCIIRFNFADKSLAFSCCHLKAGKSEIAGRTQELSDILNYNIPLKNSKEMLFKEHDIYFIFGDLNFRIDLDISNCMEFIKTGYIETLYLYDQLNKKKSISKDLMVLDEMVINFPPTYKYNIGSNDYDFKDKRVPSWCDRITFNYNPNIKGIFYNHVENFKASDHKPIYGVFKLVINEEIENNLGVKNFHVDKSNDAHYNDFTKYGYTNNINYNDPNYANRTIVRDNVNNANNKNNGSKNFSFIFLKFFS